MADNEDENNSTSKSAAAQMENPRANLCSSPRRHKPKGKTIKKTQAKRRPPQKGALIKASSS